jgi:dTDP-4-dehydrorhamnose reductase
MDRKRLLIIGARGFLGTFAVQEALSCGAYEVTRGDRTNAGTADSEELDIKSAASVNRVFENRRPDLVLLLAAMSDIDRCEVSPTEAVAVNTRGAEHVANLCARSGARLLFTSTAAVFDGSKRGYCEEDATAPLSVYGMTKLQAENAIKDLLPSAVILRFALVIGLARKMGTNGMLDKAMAQWKAGMPVFFPTREERNPIDAASLSKIMIAMLGDDAMSGVYHVGSLDSISRYELGLRLAARAGVSTELVHPQEEPVSGRAPRGEHHFLLTDKIRSVCPFRVGSCAEVIERCFA